MIKINIADDDAIILEELSKSAHYAYYMAILTLDKDTMPLFEWYDWAENADRIMQEFNRVNR